MKFRVERDVLADGVAWAARALPSRPSIPTLSGVLISSDDSELTLSGFDMEQAARVQVEATIDEPGQVLVSGRLLADIARSLPAAPVVIATEGSRLEVQCGRSSFVLPTLPVDEYPQLPEMPAPVGSASGSAFAHAVSQVAIAAGRDDTLPMLLGVRLEIEDDHVTMAATDRYRLAVREFTWNPEQGGFEGSALVPAKILADTAKLLAGAKRVSVAYAPGTSGEGLMGFEGDGRRTTTRLLDGEFPKYRQLLPSDSSSVATVEKSALVEAVKRVSLVAERNTPVRLVFSGEEVALQAGSGDEAQATESLESRIVGESIEIAFNPHYLLDGLGAIDSAEVDISFTGSAKPAVLTPSGSDSDDSYKYLLMPVRLSS
ncbi:MAG: DNA polymerase III subunit beta [Candidatus Nanopelagicales bacterium]|nr:DNA polymerase III subunit beta [Candidatus Nanopelagicales bacterium]